MVQISGLELRSGHWTVVIRGILVAKLGAFITPKSHTSVPRGF